MNTIGLERFAAMNMVYNKYSFNYFLDSMERLGISAFEMWTGTPHLYPLIDSMSDAAGIRRELERRGLRVVCLTPEQVLYPYNIAAENPELRAQSMAYFRRNLEVAAQLGADKMLCCSGWCNYDGDTEAAFGRAVEGLAALAERAAALGLTLAFEVLSTFETNLACNLTSTRRILDAVPSPAMGLCVDTVAVTMGGDSLEEYLAAFADRICHFHLTDGDPAGHVPLGTGSLPVFQFLQQLAQSGYEGDVTLEIGDTQWATRPEEATKLAFSNLKKGLGLA